MSIYTCVTVSCMHDMTFCLPLLGQCEFEGAPVPVGSLPARIGEDAPHNVFPATAGDLDDLKHADIDRWVKCGVPVKCGAPVKQF